MHPARGGHKLVRLGASARAENVEKAESQRTPRREVAVVVEGLKSGNVAEPAQVRDRPQSLFTGGRMRWKREQGCAAATLTFFILVTFAVVVGRLASSRLQVIWTYRLTEGCPGHRAGAARGASGRSRTRPRSLRQIAAPAGPVLYLPGLGPRDAGRSPSGAEPDRPGISRFGGVEIATVAVPGAPAIFVQYARSSGSLEATTDRLWLFLIAGVLGGTLLATLAGLAVRRAGDGPHRRADPGGTRHRHHPRPLSQDPRPETDDEVAELATTSTRVLPRARRGADRAPSR